MVDKFEQLAETDHRIVSAFLGGSLADGNADDYSDIDMYYLVDEQSYSDFHCHIRNWLREQGQLVFFDEHSNFGFDLILFVYQNGVKGELGLGTKQNMLSLHAGPYKVLVDKKGLLDGVVFPFQGSLKGDELRKYAERELSWYWYWYGVFLSATARGRLWSALTQLQQMRDHMFKLLVIAHNPERFPDRVARWVPDQVLDEIGKTRQRGSDDKNLGAGNQTTTRGHACRLSSRAESHNPREEEAIGSETLTKLTNLPNYDIL
jgi:hypothetical protein